MINVRFHQTRIPRRLALVTTVLVSAIPSGMAAQQMAKRAIVWPSGGERARIQYVGSLASELDVGTHSSRLERWRLQLTGETVQITTLGRPHDVHVDAQGRYWVSDMGWRRIFIFDARGKKVQTVGEEGLTAVQSPLGMAGDGRGSVYVADAMAHRVVVFNEATATMVRAIGEGLLLNPVDVAVDAARGRVYVVDSFQHQVLVFSPEGRLLQRIGKHVVLKPNVVAEAIEAIDNAPRGHSGMQRIQGGDIGSSHASGTANSHDLSENRSLAKGEFRYPSFAAVAPNGELYVTDAINFRVQVFDTAGKFLRIVGHPGDGPGGFARPKGLAVDAEGRVYVADAAFNNIQIFDSTGALLLAFPNNAKDGDAGLLMPEGILIDRDDRILVADKYGGRVQIYRFLR